MVRDLCYWKTATPQSQPTTQTQGLFEQSEEIKEDSKQNDEAD